MFDFKRHKSVLGLDIGSKLTKVVQLDFSASDRPSLVHCDLVEVGALDESFAPTMKEYFREKHLGHSLVASSIDNDSLKVRKMEFPKMPEPDLIEAIKWNMRDLIEGDIDEFTVNYSLIAEHDEGDTTKLELMAYAINRKTVVDYQQTIRHLGVEPFFIEPTAVALSSTLERCHGDDVHYLAGVDIGYKRALFYVIGKGAFVFSRPLVGVNLATYENERENFNQKVAIEIQKSLDTFKVNFKMEDVHKIYLSGGGALIPDIAGYFSQNLGIETGQLNPFSSLSVAETIGGSNPPLFVQAVGSAYLRT